MIKFSADIEIQLSKSPIVLQLDELDLVYCGENCIKRGKDVYDEKVTSSKLVTKNGVFILKSNLTKYFNDDPTAYQKLLSHIKQQINQLPLKLLKFEMIADTVARNYSNNFELYSQRSHK